tara:strand:- start:507 stop:953 length:447 start_codon:yes stop_codon:yes gene_type:complete
VLKFLIPISLIVLDLITKIIVSNTLELNQFIQVNSFFSIVYVKNFGVSFGILSGILPFWFFVLIGLLVVALIAYLSSISQKLLEKKAYFIIIIGALANIIDRSVNGFVTDFISFNYKNLFWPAFNFADIYITVGIIMLILSFFSKTKV